PAPKKIPGGRSAGEAILEGSGFRLFGGRKRTLSAEHHPDDALILGGIGAGRPGADALRQSDLRAAERGPDAVVLHVDREPEAGDRIPVSVRAHRPEHEARIAGHPRRNEDVLRPAAVAAAEYAAVDHGVVVIDLAVGPVRGGREVGQPEVL